MCQPLLCDPIPMIWEDRSTASPSHLWQSFAIHWRFPPTFIHIISPSIEKKIKFLLTLLSESTSTPFHSYRYPNSSFPILFHLFFTFIQVKDLYNRCTIMQTSPSSHTHPDFCSWGQNWNCSESLSACLLPLLDSLRPRWLAWTLSTPGRCVCFASQGPTLFSSYLAVSSFLVPGLSLWSSSLLYTHSLGTLTNEIGSKFWSSLDSCIQLPVGWDQVSDGLTPLPP